MPRKRQINISSAIAARDCSFTDGGRGKLPMTDREITDFRVAEAVRFIKSNFDRDLDFTGLAETLNLSASRLRYLFKEQTGVPFRKYLRQERMNRARRLLETSFLSVKETARQSGITDTSHFVKDFKKEFGLSPARYRKWYHSSEDNQLPERESEQKTKQNLK